MCEMVHILMKQLHSMGHDGVVVVVVVVVLFMFFPSLRVKL